MAIRTALVAAAATVALASCSDSTDRSLATDDSPPPTTRSSIPDGIIEQIECDDGAACAEEFRLNGRTYARSCGLIDPTQVDLDTELGQGYVLGREVRANALRLDPSHAVIAISAPPGTTGCVEDPGPDAPTSQWQFAFTFAGSAVADETDLICIAGLHNPDEAIDNECEQ